MTLDHSLLEELMAADALGGLDDDDRALLLSARADHGDDCAECRAIEVAFAETASRLALTLTPLPVDDSMLDRILESTRDERPAPIVTAGAASRDELSEHRTRRPRVWQALAVAAAVAAALVVAVGTLSPSSVSVTQVTASQHVVPFTGSIDGGTLMVAYTPGESGAVFWGSGLPDPEAGKVYEIWMIENEEPISGGCVSPIDGVIALRVEADIGATESMVVTKEPSECPAAPTGLPFLSADLPTVV